MPSYPYQELLHDLKEGIPYLKADEVETPVLNGSTPITAADAPLTDGDGVDRQIWVIAAGAADPADATADDLIFEEQ